MKPNIERRLLLNIDLTPHQVQYVRRHFEPKYDNDCSACRINAMLGLGISYEDAYKAVSMAPTKVDFTPKV